MNGSKCDFDGCDKRGVSLGLCPGHWAQQHRGLELRPLKPYIRKGVESKACSRCGEVKNFNNFPKRVNGTPQSMCKVCTAEYNRERYAEKARKAALWDAEQTEQGLGAPSNKTVGKDPQLIKGDAQ